MVNVGDKAPDFTLKSSSGQEVTLSALQGKKVLLAFYPFAFSSVCHDEFCEIRDGLAGIQAKGVEVFGISVDSHHAAKAFAESMQFPYQLLSDFSKKTSEAYGVLRTEGFTERAYFVIDESGAVAAKKVMDAPGTKLSYDELIALVG